MGRLTMTDEEIQKKTDVFPDFDCPVKEDEGGVAEKFCNRVCDGFDAICPFKEMAKRLKAYEDAEEQGLLLQLPCKVGDTIFVIPSKVNYNLNILNGYIQNNRVYEQKVNSIQMYNNEHYLLTSCEGLFNVVSNFYKVTWFLTKEEAEQALARMESENDGKS